MNYQGSRDQQVTLRFLGKISCGLIALLFLASTHYSFAQSPEIRKAFRYLDIEQPSKMIPALEQAVKDNPESRYYLGLGYIKLGELDKALAIFEKGISEDDKNPLNVAGKGHVKLLQKKSTEGKALIAEAADMNRRKSVEQWKAVARAYMADTKFLLDAISALNKAKELDTADPVVHQLLGDALLMQNQGQGGEAVSSYERAVRADPNWAKPLYSIAKVYRRSQNDEMVMDYLTKTIAVDPEYAPAYKDLGGKYYLEKKADKAVEAYEKYLAISETPGDAKFQYAFFLFLAKDYQRANAIFKEVLNDKNASTTALKFYAFSLIEQNKNDEAREVLEKYFQKAKPEELKPEDYAYYGKLLLKLNQDSVANEAFAKGIVLDTAKQEIELRELHAETYIKRKKFVKAAEAYEELINAREGGPLSQDLYYMGSAYYFSDQYLKADSAFTKLAEKQPTMTVGYLWAAKSRVQYDSTGELGAAIPMYEEYIEKAEENPEKNKKDLVDAYDYLGQYALHKKDNVAEATKYFQKILELDPANQRAREFMNAIER